MCRIIVVLLLFLGMFAGLCSGPVCAAKPTYAAHVADMPFNLNEITLEQLDQLPGIGPALAERIVAYRDEHGPFTRIEQLNEVKGIGARTLEKLRPYLILE